MLKAAYAGAGGWEQGDFNGDWIIDGQDFTILKAAYGTQGPPSIPEPATLSLLVLGGLAMIRKRR